MKNLFYTFGMVAIFIGLNLSQVNAQTVIASSELSQKEQKAEVTLAKAKLDLEKSKAKVIDLRASPEKRRQNFEKKDSQGKLSPNDIAKQTKAIDKMTSKIDKEERNIQKLEALIREKETL
jgi:hypothetical protein